MPLHRLYKRLTVRPLSCEFVHKYHYAAQFIKQKASCKTVRRRLAMLNCMLQDANQMLKQRLEDAWKTPGRCREGSCKAPGGNLEDAWRRHGGCLAEVGGGLAEAWQRPKGHLHEPIADPT